MRIKTSGWPVHSKDEIDAVTQVLLSGCTNYWTGDECRQFEKEFAGYVGAQYAVALMNGSVALESALMALDIKTGDEVITSCRTFIASASCIIARGATPILADVDPDSQNITAASIRACLSPRTKAIIVVHLAGWPADMESIVRLANEHNIKVIEDCAQAHGAKINNRQVGTWGDIGAFSFCQDKIMSTGGEGGMITTNNYDLWQKIWSYKDHGKNYDKIYNQQHPPGFRWLHDSFGSNWRMTEIQGAIGRLQLKKLPEWLAKRNQLANIFIDKLKNVSCLRVPYPSSDISHSYYKFYVFIRNDQLRPDWTREKIIKKMTEEGIACFSGSCSEIYLEKAFINAGLIFERRKTAKILGETSIMFLVHPTLSDNDVSHAADKLIDVLELATHPQTSTVTSPNES